MRSRSRCSLLAALVLLLGMHAEPARRKQRQQRQPAEAAAAPAAPSYDKGDISWMLVSTLLVLMMAVPGPRAVLRRHGALEEHAVGLDAGVRHLQRAVGAVGDLRLQHRVHRRQRVLRRLRSHVPDGHARCRRQSRARRDLQQGRLHSRVPVRVVPDDVRGDHAVPDRRRVRRAHEVLRGAAVHGAVVHVLLPADRAHGVVLGRSGCVHRRGSGGSGGRRPRASCSRKARSTSPAARSCTSTPASPAWSAACWSASARATARRRWRRTTCPSSWSAPRCCGSAGSASTSARTSKRTRSRRRSSSTRSSRPLQRSCAWTFAEWIFRGTPTMLGAASGAVAGLVAITPACGWVGPMGALVIGLLAGVVCLFAVTKLKSALGYDDSLDVFGVHCIGGILGAILTGVFNNPAARRHGHLRLRRRHLGLRGHGRAGEVAAVGRRRDGAVVGRRLVHLPTRSSTWWSACASRKRTRPKASTRSSTASAATACSFSLRSPAPAPACLAGRLSSEARAAVSIAVLLPRHT